MTEFLNALYKGDLSRDMRERSEGRRRAGPDIPAAIRGDQEAFGRVATAAPDIGMQIATMVHSMDAKKATQAKTRLELIGRHAGAILAAPPAQQANAFAIAKAEARAAGIDTSTWPQTWDPAAKAWVEHNARLVGTTSQIFKRMGAGQGGGAAVPARGGFGGPPMPAAGGPPRMSAAPVPDGPMVADAGASLPPPAATPAAPPMPQIAAAPPPGAGAMPMDLPPPPQIAPQGAPAAPPAQMAGGAAPPPDTATAEVRVPPQRLAMLGADFVAPRDARAAADFGLEPGEMYGLDPKKGTPIVEGNRVLVRTRDRGDVFRLLPTDSVTPMGAPKPAGGRADPAAAWSVYEQLPPGWVMGKNKDGMPAIDKNGRYMVQRPDGVWDAFEPKKAAGAAGAARYEDVRDDKGRLVGQRRADTNEYKPIDRNAGGAGKPLGDTDIKSLGVAGSSAQEFVGLRDTFNDSFGGSLHSTLGDLDNFAKRNLPDGLGGADPKGQADWWSRYQNQKNLVRNALFGSALTATEKAEFDKANIDPGMKPEVIRRNLARQADAAMRAAAKIARAKEASGYNREAIESALGLPLDTLPSPTAKPLADKPRGSSVTVPLPGSPAATPPPPKLGDVMEGHIYRGGNPADPKSWEKVK